MLIDAINSLLSEKNYESGTWFFWNLVRKSFFYESYDDFKDILGAWKNVLIFIEAEKKICSYFILNNWAVLLVKWKHFKAIDKYYWYFSAHFHSRLRLFFREFQKFLMLFDEKLFDRLSFLISSRWFLLNSLIKEQSKLLNNLIKIPRFQVKNKKDRMNCNWKFRSISQVWKCVSVLGTITRIRFWIFKYLSSKLRVIYWVCSMTWLAGRNHDLSITINRCDTFIICGSIGNTIDTQSFGESSISSRKTSSVSSIDSILMILTHRSKLSTLEFHSEATSKINFEWKLKA